MRKGALTNRTVLNIISQWVFHVANITATFFLVGYVINKVGIERYGGWVSIATVIGFSGLLDAGLSVAIQYFAAKFSAEGDKDRLTSLFSTCYVVYGTSAIVATVVCLTIALQYASLFPKVPEHSVAECSTAALWVALAMPFFILAIPMQGILLGLQLHSVRNFVEIAVALVRVAVVVLCFEFGSTNLAYLGVAFFVAMCVRLFACKLALKYVASDVRLRLSAISRPMLRELFSFAGHSVIWTASAVVVRESGPLVALIILGPEAATCLYVGTRLVRSLGSFVFMAGQVFVPLASSLQTTDDLPRLKTALQRGTRFAALLGFSAAAVLIPFGQPVLNHWIGPDSGASYLVVFITTLGLLSSWVFAVAQAMLIGLRATWFLTSLQLAHLIASVIAAVAMSYAWGTTGLATGLVLPIFLTNATIIPWFACRRMGLSLVRLLATSLPGPAAVGGIVAISSWTIQQLWEPIELHVLGAEVGIIFAIFAGLSLVIGLDAASRNMVRRRLRGQALL